MPQHQLTLIVRDGCHLCDDMRDALRAFRVELDFDWTELDVDADPALLERYHVLVPVLRFAGTDVCHHFLDLVALRTALASASDPDDPMVER